MHPCMICNVLTINDKYCSRSCVGIAKQKIGFCKTCNKQMSLRHPKQYCSLQCFHKSQSYLPASCIHCDAPLPKHRKYCSRDCQNAERWKLIKAKIEQQGASGIHIRQVRKYLLEVNGHICAICHNTKWGDVSIPLLLDHIDGNSENQDIENLRMICGNCDMLLPTYKGKNRGKGRVWRRDKYLSTAKHILPRSSSNLGTVAEGFKAAAC